MPREIFHGKFLACPSRANPVALPGKWSSFARQHRQPPSARISQISGVKCPSKHTLRRPHLASNHTRKPKGTFSASAFQKMVKCRVPTRQRIPQIRNRMAFPAIRNSRTACSGWISSSALHASATEICLSRYFWCSCCRVGICRGRARCERLAFEEFDTRCYSFRKSRPSSTRAGLWRRHDWRSVSSKSDDPSSTRSEAVTIKSF